MAGKNSPRRKAILSPNGMKIARAHPRNVSREFLPCYATATVLPPSNNLATGELDGIPTIFAGRRWRDITTYADECRDRKMQPDKKRKRAKEKGGKVYNFLSIARDYRFPMILSPRRDFLIKSVASEIHVTRSSAKKKRERKGQEEEKEQTPGASIGRVCALRIE